MSSTTITNPTAILNLTIFVVNTLGDPFADYTEATDASLVQGYYLPEGGSLEFTSDRGSTRTVSVRYFPPACSTMEAFDALVARYVGGGAIAVAA